ncbi:hypothetical protein KCU59_g13907, partial [Aureobasidium melanogenum]
MIITQQGPGHVSVPANDHDGGFLHDFLQSIIGGDPFPREIAPGGSGTWTPRNVFDFGANTDLELNDLDLNFLDGYNHEIPFTSFVETPETNRSIPASEPPSALGVESLQKSSTWRFRPVTQDRGMGDQQNISIPGGETSKRLPMQRSYIRDAIIHDAGSCYGAFHGLIIQCGYASEDHAIIPIT